MSVLIHIADIATRSELKLTGEELTEIESGGCPTLQILKSTHLSEGMTDQQIISATWGAWVADYRGDPEGEDRLEVAISRDNGDTWVY